MSSVNLMKDLPAAVNGVYDRWRLHLPGSQPHQKTTCSADCSFVFKDKLHVLLELQRKDDRREYYNLIQPHSFTETKFGVLANNFASYTEPRDHL